VGKLVRTAPPDEAAVLDETLDDLFDVERIAARSLPHQGGHSVERRMGTEEIAEQFPGGGFTEREEGQLGVVRAVRPGRVVLRPERRDHQHPRTRDSVD
jgi:hypothetical protein